MCGRYTHKLTWQQIVNLYRLTLPEEEPSGLRQSYNVAPTDAMPIIRPAGNGRELVMAGWGLIPYWLKAEDLAKSLSAPSIRAPKQSERHQLIVSPSRSGDAW
jgi:putative SOS response-associated peptidase YedK